MLQVSVFIIIIIISVGRGTGGDRGLWNTLLQYQAVTVMTNLIKIVSFSINAQTKSLILYNTWMLCCTFRICKLLISPKLNISQRTFTVQK